MNPAAPPGVPDGMRISFDLDDTLICYQPGVPQEPNGVPWALRWWVNEPLRLGAVALMKELTAAGHEVWVYTTSYRNPAAVRWWLWFHGVRVPRVIAQAEHERRFGNGGPSKHARAFGIDLHVDDSWGVWVEGRRHRFAVVVVNPHDPGWADRVRDGVARLGAGGLPVPPPDLPAEFAHLAE